MKNVHRAGLLFVVAGGAIVLAALKQALFFGIVEHVMIALAHLMIAIGVGIFVLSTISAANLRWIATLLWAGGWFALHASEMAGLLFVIPPPWLQLVAVAGILLGAAVGVYAFAYHGTPMVHPHVTTPKVALFAALSSAGVWLFDVVLVAIPGLVGVPALAGWLGAFIALAAALVTAWFGLVLLRTAQQAQAV